MEYLKNFTSLADARTQGKEGLRSPHFDIVEGYAARNYHKDKKKVFKCDFDDNAVLTLPITGVKFTASAAQTVKIVKAVESLTLYYSYDMEEWSAFTPDTEYAFGTSEHPCIYINGNNSTFNTDSATNRFIFGNNDAKVSVEGNVMYLLNNESPSEIIPNSYCFSELFKDCNAISNVSSTFLPATTLTEGCYKSMFQGCTSLVNTPNLPAELMFNYCYQYMFYGCTSLVSVSELPATALANQCYACMFSNCAALETAPSLPATDLSNGTYCYEHMFYNCSSLVNAPVIAATTLSMGCCSNMFLYCTSLIKAPELLATTRVSGCYSTMFRGCTNLNWIKSLLDNDRSINATNRWVDGVAANGDFYLVNNDCFEDGMNGVPEGWTKHLI